MGSPRTSNDEFYENFFFLLFVFTHGNPQKNCLNGLDFLTKKIFAILLVGNFKLGIGDIILLFFIIKKIVLLVLTVKRIVI